MKLKHTMWEDFRKNENAVVRRMHIPPEMLYPPYIRAISGHVEYVWPKWFIVFNLKEWWSPLKYRCAEIVRADGER